MAIQASNRFRPVVAVQYTTTRSLRRDSGPRKQNVDHILPGGGSVAKGRQRIALTVGGEIEAAICPAATCGGEA